MVMSCGRSNGTVRPYVRSKVARLKWTPHLHASFLHAIHTLGGHYKATPKLILEFMDVHGLTISQVKSHLQMYRGMRSRHRSEMMNNEDQDGVVDNNDEDIFQPFSKIMPKLEPDSHHFSNTKRVRICEDVQGKDEILMDEKKGLLKVDTLMIAISEIENESRKIENEEGSDFKLSLSLSLNQPSIRTSNAASSTSGISEAEPSGIKPSVKHYGQSMFSEQNSMNLDLSIGLCAT